MNDIRYEKLKGIFRLNGGQDIDNGEYESSYSRSGSTWHSIGKISNQNCINHFGGRLLTLVDRLRAVKDCSNIGVSFDASKKAAFTAVYVSFDWSK